MVTALVVSSRSVERQLICPGRWGGCDLARAKRLEILCTSKQVAHTFRSRAGRTPFDPISVSFRVKLEAQKILPSEPSNCANWRNHEKKQCHQHEWADDFVEY
jgi:hypothetical protein